MKVVGLSASRTGRLYPQEMFLVLIFAMGLSRPQGHGTVGRNTSLKNPVTPPGIDPGTVRLVAQRLNHYLAPGPLPQCYVDENKNSDGLQDPELPFNFKTRIM
jgi:hypothetical protein